MMKAKSWRQLNSCFRQSDDGPLWRTPRRESILALHKARSTSIFWPKGVCSFLLHQLDHFCSGNQEQKRCRLV